MLWFGEKINKPPKHPLQNTKPPNPNPQFLAVKGFPSFSWLLPVWDVGLSVYRMLLSGAAALCKCECSGKDKCDHASSHSLWLAATQPFAESSLQHNQQLLCSHWFIFSFAQHSLLKMQTKWIKKDIERFGFLFRMGKYGTFPGEQKPWGRRPVIVMDFLDAFSRLRLRLLWFLCFVISL